MEYVMGEGKEAMLRYAGRPWADVKAAAIAGTDGLGLGKVSEISDLRVTSDDGGARMTPNNGKFVLREAVTHTWGSIAVLGLDETSSHDSQPTPDRV